MSWCLLQIGDGRDDYHERARRSAATYLPRPDAVVTIDDREHSLGFAGAIAEGWDAVLTSGCDWCFHLELDFVFHRPVEIDRMIGVLEARPHLAQMALKRQPWNDAERQAGGIVELHPADFSDHARGVDRWLEHRRFWTTNPSVYSTSWCERGWPECAASEGVFTHRLLVDPDLRFGMWGDRTDPPRVEHIGEHRQGVGY